MKKILLGITVLTMIGRVFAVMNDDQICESFTAYRAANVGATANQYIENLAQEAMNAKDLDKAETVLIVYGKIKPFKAGKFLEAGSDKETKAYKALFQALDIVYEMGDWQENPQITQSQTDGKINLQRFFRRYLLGNLNPEEVQDEHHVALETIDLQTPKDEEDQLNKRRNRLLKKYDFVRNDESMHDIHIQKLFDAVRLFLAKRADMNINDALLRIGAGGKFQLASLKQHAGEEISREIQCSDASNFDGPDFFPNQKKLKNHIENGPFPDLWGPSAKRRSPGYSYMGDLNRNFYDYEDQRIQPKILDEDQLNLNDLLPDIKSAVVLRMSPRSREVMSLVNKAWRDAVNQTRRGDWVYLWDPSKIFERPFGGMNLQPWVAIGRSYYTNQYNVSHTVTIDAGFYALHHLFKDESQAIQKLKFSYSFMHDKFSYTPVTVIDEKEINWAIKGLQSFELLIENNSMGDFLDAMPFDSLKKSLPKFLSQLANHNKSLNDIIISLDIAPAFKKETHVDSLGLFALIYPSIQNMDRRVNLTYTSTFPIKVAGFKPDKDEHTQKFKEKHPEYEIDFDESPLDHYFEKASCQYTVTTKKDPKN